MLYKDFLTAKNNYRLTAQTLLVNLALMKEEKEQVTHSMVHYLLAIHKLREKKGHARVTDIASDLSLTKGSVSIAISQLKKKNLVREDDQRYLLLEPCAHQIVHKVLSTRTIIYYFLKDVLGIDDEIASRDACLTEHVMSDETMERFFWLMKTLDSAAKQGQNLDIAKLIQKPMSLDWEQYESSSSFMDGQEGDNFLEHSS